MENKYRINTWDPNGSRPMHEVIVSLIGELNESLKVPLMKEAKSYEEVRRILDNPEGIRIKELQIIDVWNVGKELRKELRDVLGEAYDFLGTEATQLIADRNELAERNPGGVDETGNININNENRKLKSVIVSQYEAIEKLVESYEKKGELSEKERNLLVYIRKIYSKALKEAIKNLFSTASESTERVKIFPRYEQKAITSKINSLQKKIRSLTRESKQKEKDQRNEKYEKLELGKKELEKKLTSLKETINSSFPNLIDSEDKISEEIQKSVIENLDKLKKIQQQVGEENEMIKEATKKLNKLVTKIKQKTSQAPDRAQIRSCLKEVKDNLEQIATELTSSNQQLTAQIEQKV